MEKLYLGIGFFAAAFVVTVAAIVLGFSDAEQWSVALSVVAVIFAFVGIIFTVRSHHEHHQHHHKAETEEE